MRLKFNSWIFKIWPLSNFDAITLPWAIYFRRPESMVAESTLQHELVHIEQRKRIGSFTFYRRYLGEFLANLIRYRFDAMKAYEEISFEKEAYALTEPRDEV